MDFGSIYHFLFETYVGIGVLIGVSLVVCIIIAALLELRTRKTYVDRGPREDDEDEWSFFDDEVTPNAVHNDLTRYAAKNACDVVDINFYRDSTCMLPIPYVNTTFGILWYREIQVSGVLVRPNPKPAAKEVGK